MKTIEDAVRESAMSETECRYELEAEWGGEWLPAEFVTEHDGRKIYAIYTDAGTPLYWPLQDFQLRNARTDRERWVEKATHAHVNADYPCSEFEAVYDALLSGELPTPGGDQ